MGRFFYTDQYQSSVRWEGNAIQALQDADLSLSLQVTPSSPKQVNTPTHNYVKVCLNREYIQRILTQAKEWAIQSKAENARKHTQQPIGSCALIISVQVISKQTDWLLGSGLKLYFLWIKYVGYILCSCAHLKIHCGTGWWFYSLSLPPGFTQININLILHCIKFYTLHWRFNTVTRMRSLKVSRTSSLLITYAEDCFHNTFRAVTDIIIHE